MGYQELIDASFEAARPAPPSPAERVAVAIERLQASIDRLGSRIDALGKIG